MIQFIASVYDHAAEAYLDPFHIPKPALALRAFRDCINSPEHQFGRHPDQYTLFTLGTFDNSDASYVLATKSLGNGVLFINPPEPESPDEIDPDPPILPDKESGNSA